MNRIKTLLILSLITGSSLNGAAPSRLDYFLAGLNPMVAYVGTKEADKYKEIALDRVALNLQHYGFQDYGKVEFYDDLGPSILTRDGKPSDPNMPTLDWQGLLVVGAKGALRISFRNSDYLPLDQYLNPLIDQHKELTAKLINAHWSPQVKNLVEGDFFKLIDKQTGVNDDHVALLIIAHRHAVTKGALQTKIALGVIALATAIGFSIKPLYKKLKEKKQNDNQAAQPAA